MENFFLMFTLASLLFPVVLGAGSDDCPSTKIQPLGCYNEGSIGLFTHTLAMNSNNSVLNCTGRCREAGFTYAAMINGTGCSCGRLQPHLSDRRPTTECGVNCPGDKSEKCGGTANRITAYYVEPFGCNWLNVLESTDYSGDTHATNVAVDSCQHTTLSGKTTHWLAPQRSTGLNAHFIVELGCKRVVDRITVRNTITGKTPGSTCNFQIEFSNDRYQWTKIFAGAVPVSTSCSNPLSVEFKFEPRPTQYVRFVALSYYGSWGAGLEYFDVSGPPSCNCNNQQG